MDGVPNRTTWNRLKVFPTHIRCRCEFKPRELSCRHPQLRRLKSQIGLCFDNYQGSSTARSAQGLAIAPVVLHKKVTSSTGRVLVFEVEVISSGSPHLLLTGQTLHTHIYTWAEPQKRKSPLTARENCTTCQNVTPFSLSGVGFAHTSKVSAASCTLRRWKPLKSHLTSDQVLLGPSPAGLFMQSHMRLFWKLLCHVVPAFAFKKVGNPLFGSAGVSMPAQWSKFTREGSDPTCASKIIVFRILHSIRDHWIILIQGSDQLQE